MRVLMLSWEYPPKIVGGVSRVVYDLAQKLAVLGNEIHVATCREQGAEAFEKDGEVFVHRVLTYDNIETTDFINWVHHFNFSLIEYISNFIYRTGRFDILHAHEWIVAFASRVLKHAFHIPMVCTIHATEYGRNGGIHSREQRYISSLEWWLTYEAWKVIVNSQYMSSEVKRIFQIPGDKLRIISNGVHLDRFKGFERDMHFRRRFALDNEKILLFVGRLVNEKGVQVLIDAMPKILANYHDAKLVIVGKGPQQDFLKEKAWHMDLSRKICFAGYVDDNELGMLYKCADVAVFPSLYEPFGIVALEGMLADVPVVVSDTGGLNEIVSHGVDGMKSYTGNPNSLADSILELLFNPSKAEEIRKRAMEKVRTMFNWELISKKTLEVYDEVVRESRRSGWSLMEGL